MANTKKRKSKREKKEKKSWNLLKKLSWIRGFYYLILKLTYETSCIWRWKEFQPMDHMLIWWAYVVKIIFVHKFLVIWFFFLVSCQCLVFLIPMLSKLYLLLPYIYIFVYKFPVLILLISCHYVILLKTSFVCDLACFLVMFRSYFHLIPSASLVLQFHLLYMAF